MHIRAQVSVDYNNTTTLRIGSIHSTDALEGLDVILTKYFEVRLPTVG